MTNEFVTYNDEKITVYVDGEIANITEATIDLTNNNIYVGHNPLNTTMAFDGNIEMLAFKNELLSIADLRSKLVNNYCTHIGKEYDSLNRVVKNKIKTNESTFTIDYTYDKYRPIREEYSNGESINYSYDEMGNIITKTTTSSLGTEIISYEYDKIGRLTKEIRGNEQTTEYTYDIYGNLTSTKTTVGTNTPVIKTYSYSGNNVTVTNVNTNTVKTLLEYNSNNTGFPNKMFVGLSLENLTWEGNRLKSIGTDITYVYNLAGIRTKKTTPYETTTYVVDGSKIIRMNKKLIDDTVITIDFMYDQNDILVQAKTKEGCYFYVRDITGNINGLIDKNGNYVVKYRYDAWGNVLNTSITQNFLIAEHNPFLYKGYYYDVETKVYYCNSRYYSPELCRWISPDSIEYLDPQSINGFNLYCYCGNDPVNYKQRPVSSGGSVLSSSISSISNGGIYSSGSVSSGTVGSSRINWENGGFQIPIWISSLMSGSDFGASIAPALRTIYQYIRYTGVKDLNKLYGLDFVPGKLNTVCSVIGYGLLGINIGLSAWSNFTNDNLTTKQQWISFGVDTAYTLGTFGIGYGVGALVSLIPDVGVFIAPFASAGVTWFIYWTNEKWGWLDDVKQWFNDL